MAFCKNCGQKLSNGAKFCANCGSSTGQGERKLERVEVYDGEIHKCPHCGEGLKAFEAVCPVCKFELRGVKVISSVQELSKKLQSIEEKRARQGWNDIFKQFFTKKISWVDQEKITLIKTFPVPNTKEDILEFVMLASANLHAYDDNKGNECAGLYDAWDMKMEQTIQKVVVVFQDDTEFFNRVILILPKKYKKLILKLENKNRNKSFLNLFKQW